MITASLSNLNFRTYRYSFQGQEKDDEVAGASNSINYTYRMHDVRVGRFFAVDPLAGKYPMLSSYQFSSNNPIGMIEIEGLEGMALVNKEKDKYAYASSYLEFDKSAIHIFIHGSPAGITAFNNFDGTEVKIATSSDFSTLIQKSSNYNVLSQAGNLFVVLHSCRTGRPIKNADGTYTQSVAQIWSRDLGITIIAPDERDYFGSSGEEGPRKTAGTDANSERTKVDGKSTGELGNWLVYTEGVLVAVYSGDWSPHGNPGAMDKAIYGRSFTYLVSWNTLNLRQGPSTSFDTLGDQLVKGDELIPTGKFQDGWAEVTTKDGRTGWITGDAVVGKVGGEAYGGGTGCGAGSCNSN